MNIPNEAVEAAARAMLDKMYDDKTLRVDDEDRDIMRAALEAAAPHMLGEAWQEGRQAGHDHMIGKQSGNPYKQPHEN